MSTIYCWHEDSCAMASPLISFNSHTPAPVLRNPSLARTRHLQHKWLIWSMIWFYGKMWDSCDTPSTQWACRTNGCERLIHLVVLQFRAGVSITAEVSWLMLVMMFNFFNAWTRNSKPAAKWETIEDHQSRWVVVGSWSITITEEVWSDWAWAGTNFLLAHHWWNRISLLQNWHFGEAVRIMTITIKVGHTRLWFGNDRDETTIYGECMESRNVSEVDAG